MSASIFMIRVFFLLLSMMFFGAFFNQSPYLSFIYPPLTPVIGGCIGFLFGSAIMAFEIVLKKTTVRLVNTLSLGLLFGYLLGQTVLLVVNGLIDISDLPFDDANKTFGTVCLFLFCLYWALVLTIRSSEEIAVSIPFVRFNRSNDKKKDVLLDISVLSDPRIIDLCASGILDQHLIFPRFLLQQIYAEMEHGDESGKMKARRSFDTIKRLETMDGLGLRIVETEFPDVKDLSSKLIHLAQVFHANILTAQMSRVQQAKTDDVKIININSLSNALKSPKQHGESLQIKVQRYGKEPRQGVGYLEDGTMVVVNGGAEFIGETISAQVLSVKHTSSGRMIFCNAVDESDAEGGSVDYMHSSVGMSGEEETSSDKYLNHL